MLFEEIKTLYVSVTHAKQRISFFDEDEAHRAPIFELLESCTVAKKMSLRARSQLASAKGAATSLAQASTAEEWRAQGLVLFRAQRFDGAVQCFEKIKDWLEYSEANACRYVSNALLTDSSPESAAEKLATAFLSLDNSLFCCPCCGRR